MSLKTIFSAAANHPIMPVLGITAAVASGVIFTGALYDIEQSCKAAAPNNQPAAENCAWNSPQDFAKVTLPGVENRLFYAGGGAFIGAAGATLVYNQKKSGPKI